VYSSYRLTSGESREKMDLTAKEILKDVVWNPHKLTESTYCLAENSYSTLTVEKKAGVTFRERLAKSNKINEPLSFIPFVKNIAYSKNLSKSANFKNIVPTTAHVPILCYGYVLSFLPIRLHHVHSHMDGFNFITSHKEKETFWTAGKIFVRPFQWEVWVAFGLAITGTTLAFLISKYLLPLRFDVLSNLSSIIFNLLEVGLNDKQLRAIQSRFMLKTIFGVWVVTGVVLTNAYKGIIISYLCSPFPQFRLLKYFKELDNFTHYTPSISTFHTDWQLCGAKAYEITCLSPDWKVWGNYTKYKDMSYERCNQMHLDHSHLGQLFPTLDYLKLSDETRAIFQKLGNSTLVFPPCKFQDLVQRMNQVSRSAYVTWNNELDDFLRILQRENNKQIFYKGQELFHVVPRNWYVTKVPHSLPYFRLKQLIESGIYQHLKFWLQDVAKIGSEKRISDDLAPISTNHNLFFIFHILLFGCLIASLIFTFRKVCDSNPSRSIPIGCTDSPSAELNKSELVDVDTRRRLELIE